jgi:hypothetical protein
MMTFTASAELSEVGNTFTPKWLDMTMKATSFSGSNIQVLADSMTTFFFFFFIFLQRVGGQSPRDHHRQRLWSWGGGRS